jgi:CheY-like chemotaxis protein
MMSLKKVLLVDDDKALNFINRLTIQDHASDCHIAEALDGQQALDYLAALEECPDIIFLDINMPGMDGFEFLDEMERRGKCCDNSKIFMLTSSIREEDKSRAMSSELVKGYFDKPLSNEHIEEILAKAS